MLHNIAIDIDAGAGHLAGFEDSYLASLWHVGQINPAAHGDAAAGALVRALGDEIVRRWLAGVPAPRYAHQVGDAAAATAAAVPAAGSPEIGSAFGGGIYAGIASNADGAYRLVLLDGEQGDLDWEAAKSWASSVDGELPNRVEQAMLYAHLKDQFKGAWYWSYAPAGSSNAWLQDFNDGNQYDNHRSSKGRARAVRRLPI